MFSKPNNNTTSYKAYVLFGRTQSCKSSFIRDICGEGTQIDIGTGFKGISTTKTLKFYSGSNPNFLNGAPVYFIDTVGWGDSNEDFSDDEVMQMISNFLLEKTQQNHIDGIIITESMMNDNVCLKNSLAMLHQIFGASFKDSSIVLATKPNAVVHEEDLKERLDEVLKVTDEQNVRGGVMPFKTSYMRMPKSSFSFDQQLKDLAPKLLSLNKLNLAFIDAQRQAIHERALEIQKQKTKTETRYIPYTEVVYEKQQVLKTKAVVKTRNVEERRSKRFLGIRVGHRTISYQVPYIENVSFWAEEEVPRNVKRQKEEMIQHIPEYDVCWREAFEEHKKKVPSMVRTPNVSRIDRRVCWQM